MKKNIVIMLCIIVFSMTSCTDYEDVTFIESGNSQHILYQNNQYYVTDIFTATKYYSVANENDVKLGWYYSFPFTTYFYSDRIDNPIYIYTIGSDTNVYLRQDYDYKSDSFIIDNTFDTIVFSEAIIGACFEYNSSIRVDELIEISLYSKEHPNLKISLHLFRNDENWCLVFPTNEAYIISPSLESILINNGIVKNER